MNGLSEWTATSLTYSLTSLRSWRDCNAGILWTFSTESFHSDGKRRRRRWTKESGARTALFAPKYKPLRPSFSDGNLSSSLKMNKFKTCREILLLGYADNNISDEEFVPLYDCYRSKKSRFRLSIVRCFRSRKHEFS